MWRLPPPSSLSRSIHDIRGLVVTGTHARCGKTVFCAGLVGVLNDLGFRLQAIKPMSFSSTASIRRAAEQEYFDRLYMAQPASRLPGLQPMSQIVAETPHDVGSQEWKRLLETARKRIDPYVLETPGNLSTPIRGVGDEVMDAINLARTLYQPIILVTQKHPDILSVLPTAFAYAALRDAPLMGWVAVETTPLSPAELEQWPENVLYCRRQFGVPFLGEIPYSPSISVETGRQGNLYRLTETGLDILPIQQALDMTIPV